MRVKHITYEYHYVKHMSVLNSIMIVISHIVLDGDINIPGEEEFHSFLFTPVGSLMHGSVAPLQQDI